jgi:hypothetical protein
MPIFSTAQRLKIALGGFVCFTGFLVLACAILTITGATNLDLVFGNGLGTAVVTTVAALDVVCGLLLVLRNKEIVLSFTSHQEKADNNTH